MNLRLQLFRTRPGHWDNCVPPSPADRMERYSPRHAADMRARQNAGAAAPRVRIVDGKEVMVALPGRVNRIVKRKRLPYPDVQMTREPVPDCPQRDQF